jgi:hypothetical protein
MQAQFGMAATSDKNRTWPAFESKGPSSASFLDVGLWR